MALDPKKLHGDLQRERQVFALYRKTARAKIREHEAEHERLKELSRLAMAYLRDADFDLSGPNQRELYARLQAGLDASPKIALTEDELNPESNTNAARLARK